MYVANWPEKRSAHWNTLLNARAIENQSFVIGVNRVGTDEKGLSYQGDSKVVDALGEEEKLEPKEECVKTVVLKMNKLKTIREALPFLKDG